MKQNKQIILMIDEEWTNYDKEKEIFKNEGLSFIPIRYVSKDFIFNEFKESIIGLIVRANIRIRKIDIYKLDNLKVICVTGSGFDCVDIDAATKKNIVVVYQGDYCAREVAEHVIAMIFCFNKNLIWYNERVKKGIWQPDSQRPIKSMSNVTLGIVGFGYIGRSVANMAVSLGLNVLVYDPYIDKAFFDDLNVTSCNLKQLLSQSDYVSVHLPLVKETRNMFTEDLLNNMKQGSVFINTCRGGIVDEKALIKLIKNGHIGAAGLDVLKDEPPKSDNPLLELKNTLITPHIAYRSIQSVEKVKIGAAKDVIRVLKRQDKPNFIANPEVW